ncbi:MAG TPA: class I SAM-dependent methyltransferase [Vicinamibacterales bacterium]|nr:class I SAM-dependent methyltransferase [Vicinamibacterales bacterium]
MSLLSVERAYELWAESYPPVAHNALMRAEQSAVLSLLPRLTGLSALDAGCGTGRYARLLVEGGARRVCGVDRSMAMLMRARTGKAALGDLHSLPFVDSAFDVVVSGLVLNDTADLCAAVREIARVLNAGGVLLYSTLHPRGAQMQWTRTFERDGRTWTLPAHWHSLHAHQSACAAAGLAIEAVREPALADRGAVALVIRARRDVVHPPA